MANKLAEKVKEAKKGEIKVAVKPTKAKAKAKEATEATEPVADEA